VIKIAPSILSADFTCLGDQVTEAEAAGADYIHIDVMDGHFVPNITIGPLIVKAARRSTSLPLSVHLMIEGPERYLQAFADAGADIITVHVETCPHLHRTIQHIRSLGKRAGVAINPATPPAALDEIVDDLDLILIMSVNPGFGGQSFIERSVHKIGAVRVTLDQRGSEADLSVDGGIKPGTAERVVRAGANVLVAGSAIFGAPEGIGPAIAQLRACAVRAESGNR